MIYKIEFHKLRDDVVVPQIQTEGSAGADLVVPDDTYIPPFHSVGHGTLVPLGFSLDIPKGMQVHIMLRSSVGLNTPLRLSNGVGLIDSDYKGEICLLLDNLSKNIVFIKSGTRIAQMLPFCSAKWELSSIVPLSREKRDKIPIQKRTGGFGSTNRKRSDSE
jgi:dUTP pyrophosphatase|nr:MAG TPA: dUTPase [Caudoviricetes sp.]